MSSIERRFSLSIPQNESEGSWDRYGYWALTDDCVIAFVADAPVAASRDSGRIIESAIGQCLKRDSGEIEIALSLGLGGTVVADLATLASDALVREGKGQAYAALAIVAIHGGETTLFCRGDCAVYLLAETPRQEAAILRFSGTTRVGGRVVLPRRGGDKTEADHYEEGIYLGGESRIVDPGETQTAPARRILMVSDGCEAQAGISDLAALLKSEDFSRESLSRIVEARPLRDDVSAVGIEIHAAPAAEELVPMESADDGTASRRMAALEAETAGLRERLGGLERTLAETAASVDSAEVSVGAEPPVTVEPESTLDPVEAPGAAGAETIRRANRVSPVRRIFGILLSLAGLAAIGWLIWFLYHQFLDELNENQSPEKDPAAEVAGPGESGEVSGQESIGSQARPAPAD